MKYTKAELSIIWLDSFSELEYKHKREFINFIKETPDLNALLQEYGEVLEKEKGGKFLSSLKSSLTKEYFDNLLLELDRKKIKVITCHSSLYPKELFDMQDYPLCFYCKGNENLFKDQKFTIVGSRKSISLSINLAKTYTEAMLNAGYTIVTGIAEGVEKEILEEGIKKGKIISVYPCGLDYVYPSSHLELIERVAKSGLIISEFPPSVSLKPYMFPVRNRILAGLSIGVLVVSGGLKSGTNWTAEYAVDLNRDVFAIPYSVNVESGAGCNELIKKGAIITTSKEDLLNFYGKEIETKKVILSPEEKEIISTLKDGELHIEKIAINLNKQVFSISSSLAMLEIKGVVYRCGANIYGLTGKVTEA